MFLQDLVQIGCCAHPRRAHPAIDGPFVIRIPFLVRGVDQELFGVLLNGKIVHVP